MSNQTAIPILKTSNDTLNQVQQNTNKVFRNLHSQIRDIANSENFQFFVSDKVSTNSTTISSSTFTTYSNSPAFKVNPTQDGKYKVYASFPLGLTLGTSAVVAARIFNTSGGAELLFESQSFAYNQTPANDLSFPAFIQSVYNLKSGIEYIFDIQGRVVNGVTATESDASDGPYYMFAELCG